MIEFKDPEHRLGVLKFAASVGAVDKLIERLEYLATYGEGDNICHLHRDFAPNSFEFLMHRPDGSRWFNGGLIYRGPGAPGDGSNPSLTVSLCQSKELHSWGVHT